MCVCEMLLAFGRGAGFGMHAAVPDQPCSAPSHPCTPPRPPTPQEMEAAQIDEIKMDAAAAPAHRLPQQALPASALPAAPTAKPAAPAKTQEELELEALEAEMAL